MTHDIGLVLISMTLAIILLRFVECCDRAKERLRERRWERWER